MIWTPIYHFWMDTIFVSYLNRRTMAVELNHRSSVEEMQHRIMACAIILALLLLSFIPCSAKIYKFQKNGTWYYTDTPPEDMPGNSQELDTGKPDRTPQAKGERQLLAGFATSNAIEKAAAGTVFIKTAIGSGSGFFISDQGHLITNKHVIRVNEHAFAKTDTQFDQVEKHLDETEERLDNERQRLRDYHDQLDSLERRAESETRPDVKQYYTREHAQRLEYYRQWQADFQNRLERFEEKRKEFEAKRSGYDYSKTVADLSQSFTIILADSSQYYVRLIATSAEHDLALLKLDGYRTPMLRPASAQTLAQGDPVYAIGSPAQLQNSVTSGVLSGFEGGFVQTNAQIYPGNSGGPLVTAEGLVLGINTFKRLTHKYEGLGFAIPIHIAIEEFAPYLP